MGWLLTNLIASFLLPPLALLLIGALGLALLKRRPRLGEGLLALSLGLLAVLSLPAVSGRLLASLEQGALLPQENRPEAQAIVVLGGGRDINAPEYGGDTVGWASLERLRYGAKLQRQTGLPLLVTGGKPDGGELSEGEIMRRVLEREFGVPVRWVEDRSDNTRENAYFSRELLKGGGVQTIYLVTHAWHMPRAKRVFEAAGFKVVPAGVGFHQTKAPTALDFLPDARALEGSVRYIHEIIGLVWYRLKS
jgi:uncharacterized SAM-binding protein YcdF (DUF218 family)